MTKDEELKLLKTRYHGLKQTAIAQANEIVDLNLRLQKARTIYTEQVRWIRELERQVEQLKRK
jgi:hypothetical protein